MDLCTRFSSSSNGVNYEKCSELSGEPAKELREKVRSCCVWHILFPMSSHTYWKKGFYGLQDLGKNQKPLMNNQNSFSFNARTFKVPSGMMRCDSLFLGVKCCLQM